MVDVDVFVVTRVLAFEGLQLLIDRVQGNVDIGAQGCSLPTMGEVPFLRSWVEGAPVEPMDRYIENVGVIES